MIYVQPAAPNLGIYLFHASQHVDVPITKRVPRLDVELCCLTAHCAIKTHNRRSLCQWDCRVHLQWVGRLPNRFALSCTGCPQTSAQRVSFYEVNHRQISSTVCIYLALACPNQGCILSCCSRGEAQTICGQHKKQARTIGDMQRIKPCNFSSVGHCVCAIPIVHNVTLKGSRASCPDPPCIPPA